MTRVTGRPPGLRELIGVEKAYLAPAVFNPLCAKIAAAAGFQMLYLGGGTLGYIKCGLEANLDITELTQAGTEIRAVSDLPLILDGACGFGDPMHMHHVIPLAEAAGFAAIEIEDQILPKRAHHHIGVEQAMQQTYGAILAGEPNPAMGGVSRKAEQAALHDTLGFDRLIEIEKRTVEKE